MGTRNLIHLYTDGDQWCAIYPMGSNIQDCVAVAFAPKDFQESKMLNRTIDYGKWNCLEKLKSENPDLPTHSFYCEK
jgi:hypothetical protein